MTVIQFLLQPAHKLGKKAWRSFNFKERGIEYPDMNMKERLKNILNFCCMVVILGTQTLLEGSWKVADVDTNGNNPMAKE